MWVTLIDKLFFSFQGGGWKREAEPSEGAAGGGYGRQHRAFGGFIPRAERRGGMSVM